MFLVLLFSFHLSTLDHSIFRKKALEALTGFIDTKKKIINDKNYFNDYLPLLYCDL